MQKKGSGKPSETLDGSFRSFYRICIEQVAGLFFDNRRNFNPEEPGGGSSGLFVLRAQAFRRSAKCLRSLATLGAEVNMM